MTQEPLWWEAARKLRAQGWSLKRIGREVERHYTSVLYAIRDDVYRERHRAKSRQRWLDGREHRIWPGGYDVRGSVVRAARYESQATGVHIDTVLITWGATPRFMRGLDKHMGSAG